MSQGGNETICSNVEQVEHSNCGDVNSRNEQRDAVEKPNFHGEQVKRETCKEIQS